MFLRDVSSQAMLLGVVISLLLSVISIPLIITLIHIGIIDNNSCIANIVAQIYFDPFRIPMNY